MALLPPYGYAEEKNAALWIEMGFGVDFQEWKKRQFDLSILERLHHNLLARRGKGQSYVDSVKRRLLETSAA